MELSERARQIQESPIRKLASIAEETKRRGIHIYHLNIGQPDIPTPNPFYQGITNYSEKVLSYGPSDGLIELKEAMVSYFSYFNISLETKNISITTGGSEAILFAFSVVADAGDEIIIPEPFYTNYNGYATLANVRITPVPTVAETGFHLPQSEEFEGRISDKTKAILLCSPNNPTGAIYSEAEIRKIGELVKEYNLYLITDEVYKEFTYDGKTHFSALQLEGLEDRVIVVDSISKRYSACGARIGAIISKNEAIIQSVLKFAQARLCPPTLEQAGAIKTYRMPRSYFIDTLKEYEKRRNILHGILTSNKDIILQKPEGAFYLMVKLPVNDTDNFARWLLESFEDNRETVMVAPGAGFYSTPGSGKQEVRIAYVLETHKLEQAGNIILKALSQYSS
jgi:aspartate aminotransferase